MVKNGFAFKRDTFIYWLLYSSQQYLSIHTNKKWHLCYILKKSENVSANYLDCTLGDSISSASNSSVLSPCPQSKANLMPYRTRLPSIAQAFCGFLYWSQLRQVSKMCCCHSYLQHSEANAKSFPISWTSCIKPLIYGNGYASCHLKFWLLLNTYGSVMNVKELIICMKW